VAKFSARDAERLDVYHARLGAVSDLVRALMLETPPNVTDGGLLAALPELMRGLSAAWSMPTVAGAGLRIYGASAFTWPGILAIADCRVFSCCP